MIIKDIKRDELATALRLVWRVFTEFAAKDCSEGGIAEFKHFLGTLPEKLNNGIFMKGCFVNKVLAGVCAFKGESHISLLFVDRKYQRMGIATALLDSFIRHINTDVKEITVNASPYAVPIYKKLGFNLEYKNMILNGIKFKPMKKIL